MVERERILRASSVPYLSQRRLRPGVYTFASVEVLVRAQVRVGVRFRIEGQGLRAGWYATAASTGASAGG